jgi:beta-xylosidase
MVVVALERMSKSTVTPVKRRSRLQKDQDIPIRKKEVDQPVTAMIALWKIQVHKKHGRLEADHRNYPEGR